MRSRLCVIHCVLSHCSHCTVGSSVKDDRKREDEINCLCFPNYESIEILSASSEARNSVMHRHTFITHIIFYFFPVYGKISHSPEGSFLLCVPYLLCTFSSSPEFVPTARVKTNLFTHAKKLKRFFLLPPTSKTCNMITSRHNHFVQLGTVNQTNQ